MFASLPPFSCADVPLTDRRQKWMTWKRGFEIFLRAAKVEDAAEKKDSLLAHGGFELQDIFFNIPGADVEAKEDNDCYAIAIEKLDSYFAPQRHEAHERYVFWAMKPEPGESLTKFLMRTQTHASKCNFGKTSTDSSSIAVIDKMLQFVPASLREKLLQATDLTIDEVVKQVNAFETSRSASEQISGQAILPAVSKNTESVQRVKAYCKFCGKNHGPGQNCAAWNKTCGNCGKVGHFRAVCFSRMGQPGSSTGSSNQPPTKSAIKRNYSQTFQPSATAFGKQRRTGTSFPPRRLHAIADEEEEVNIELVEMVSSANDSEELVWVKVGGVIIEMQIDSGVHSNIVDDRTWEMMLNNGVETLARGNQSDKKFKAYAQRDCLEVLEMFDAEVIINDGNKELKTNARFYVVRDGPQPLLGKHTAQQLGVLVVGLPSQQSLQNVGSIRPFPSVRGVKIHIPVDKSVQPVVQRFRRLPFATLERVDDKLKELLAKDIIEKVSEPSRWVSPMVVVIKDSGDIRLCIDMRQVNKAVLRETHPLPTIEDVRWKLNGAVYFSRLDIKDAFHQLELDDESKPLTTFITHKGKFN